MENKIYIHNCEKCNKVNFEDKPVCTRCKQPIKESFEQKEWFKEWGKLAGVDINNRPSNKQSEII